MSQTASGPSPYPNPATHPHGKECWKEFYSCAMDYIAYLHRKVQKLEARIADQEKP